MSTLARRPSRPGALQLVARPCALLFQLGGITLGSMLVPGLADRRQASSSSSQGQDHPLHSASTSAQQARTRATQPSAPAFAPSSRQLLQLSTVIRKQLATKSFPFDAVFTLRNLHMYTNVPHLAFPNSTCRLPAASVYPEKWIWRLPAATAIHAIVRRIARAPNDVRTQTELIPIALTLARHALAWDMLVWLATLYNHNQHGAPGWAELTRLATSARGGTGVDQEVIIVLNSRAKALASVGARSRRRRRFFRRLERSRHQDTAQSVGRGDETNIFHTLGREIECPKQPRPLHDGLKPMLSMPVETLEVLYWALLDCPAIESADSLALSLCLETDMLRRSLSFAARHQSVKVALAAERPDLAAQMVTTLLRDAATLSAQQQKQTTEMLSMLCNLLPKIGDRGAAVQRRSQLAAWSLLPGMLRVVWAQAPSGQATLMANHQEQMTLLLQTLTAFPTTPRLTSLPDGTKLHRDATVQAEVELEVMETLNQTVRSLAQHPVASSDESAGPWSALRVVDCNILLKHALRRMKAPDVAVSIARFMKIRGLSANNSTHSILLNSGIEPFDAPDSFDPVGGLRLATRLLRHLVRQTDHEGVRALTLKMLPQLDIHLEGEEEKGPPNASRYLPPQAYLEVLSALVCAEQVGLAERVFRLARMSAEQSRQNGKTGWTLPTQAFILMFQMYANEVIRGRKLEKRVTSDGRPDARAFVKGWGRNAIRVHVLEQRRTRLEAQLGTGEKSKQEARQHIRTDRFISATEDDREMPEMLRSQAAPIVAVWELQGGSKGPELESLRHAIKSPEARRSLSILFPDKVSPFVSINEALRVGKSKANFDAERARVQSVIDRGHD
ncbi:hypothetical protein OIV83_000328 [Microbotryomycetes sp. JL201]|nr:hypothetical protein OIV83_000328 [Microbotryomycetes sp. JL201]